MKQKISIMLLFVLLFVMGCRQNSNTVKQAPEKSLPTTGKDTTQEKSSKTVNTKHSLLRIRQPQAGPTEEAEKAVSSMSLLTIVRVTVLAQTIDCLAVNEPDARRRAREVARLLERSAMSMKDYEQKLQRLSQFRNFINDLEKAQKECRVSRTELLEILTDKGCVKKAYKKAGFDDVPSPLERFYGYRGKIIGYLKYVKRRYSNDSAFKAALKKRIAACPNYDLKQLRNGADGLCSKDNHCLPNLKCYRGTSPWVCRSQSDIALLTEQTSKAMAKNQECRGKPACKQKGHCTYFEGRCVLSQRDCARSELCQIAGKCVEIGDVCAPVTHQHCAVSKLCKSQGKCVHRNGVCVIGTVKDCKESKECEKRGHCSLVKQECIPGKLSDCRQSNECKLSGLCTLEIDACVVGSSADCNGLRNCKRFGWCTRVVDSFPGKTTNTAITEIARCGVATSADCKRSNLCKNEGRCTAKGNACVK